MAETKQEIKEAVKKVFGLKTKRDGLSQQIETIDKELAEYGIEAGSFSSDKPRRTDWPELTVETVKTFIQSLGTAGTKAGELRDHFGPSWGKWSKENAKHFKIHKDGIKRIWNLKA
jgi:hypothetical protein